MLKVLWCYKRPTTNKNADWQGWYQKTKQQKHSSVIRGKWGRYHMCDKAKIIPQNLHAI